eukprot:GGOE01044468.1.p1 GENE.GGOE01044468.1~~GGOE01044468.1.p1  ORF type:complete len:796 (-),score=257.75 GGOE01044468.1:351-2738(-)
MGSPPWLRDVALQMGCLLLPLLTVPALRISIMLSALVVLGCAGLALLVQLQQEDLQMPTDTVQPPVEVAVPWLFRVCVQSGSVLAVVFVLLPQVSAMLCSVRPNCPTGDALVCVLYCSVLASGHLYTTRELILYASGRMKSDEGQPLLPPDSRAKPISYRAGISGVQALTVLLCGASVVALGLLLDSALSGPEASCGVVMATVGLLSLARSFGLLLAVGDAMSSTRITAGSRKVIGLRSLFLFVVYGVVLLLAWPAHYQLHTFAEPEALPTLRPIVGLCSIGLILAGNTIARSLSIPGPLSDVSFRLSTLVHAGLLVNLSIWLANDIFASQTGPIGVALGLLLASFPVMSCAVVPAFRVWRNPSTISGIPSPKGFLLSYGLILLWVIGAVACLCKSAVHGYELSLPLLCLLPFPMYIANELCQAMEALVQMHDLSAMLRADRALQEKRVLSVLRGVVTLLPILLLAALAAPMWQGTLQVSGSQGGGLSWLLMLSFGLLVALLSLALGDLTHATGVDFYEVLEMTSTSPRSCASSITLVSAPPVRRIVNVEQLNAEGRQALSCIQGALDPDSERFQLDLRATQAVPEYGASILYQILSFNEGSLVQLLPFCEDSARYSNALRELYNTTRDGLAVGGLHLPPYWQMTELEGRELALGIEPDRRTMFQILQEPANVWLVLCNRLADEDFQSIFTSDPSLKVKQTAQVVRDLFVESKRDLLQKVVSARNMKAMLLSQASPTNPPGGDLAPESWASGERPGSDHDGAGRSASSLGSLARPSPLRGGAWGGGADTEGAELS